MSRSWVHSWHQPTSFSAGFHKAVSYGSYSPECHSNSKFLGNYSAFAIEYFLRVTSLLSYAKESDLCSATSGSQSLTTAAIKHHLSLSFLSRATCCPLNGLHSISEVLAQFFRRLGFLAVSKLWITSPDRLIPPSEQYCRSRALFSASLRGERFWLTLQASSFLCFWALFWFPWFFRLLCYFHRAVS